MRSTEISNYYMIGDNPAGDILGANKLGIKSILVRSGIYDPHQYELTEEMTPTFEVENMEEAVRLILNQENLKV